MATVTASKGRVLVVDDERRRKRSAVRPGSR